MPDYRERALQEVAADFESRGVVRREGAWMRKQGDHWYPVGEQLQATLEQAVYMRMAFLQQEEQALAEAARRIQQEAAQRAAESMGPGYRAVQWQGAPQLRGDLRDAGGGLRWDRRAAARADRQAEFQRRYQAELDRRRQQATTPEEPESEAEPPEQETPESESGGRTRRGWAWPSLRYKSAAQGAVASLIGVGLAGLQSVTTPMMAGAGVAMSPFGQAGQSTVGIGQAVLDLLLNGIKSMATIGSAALGAALAAALPGPLGIGLAMAAGLIAGQVANAFGAVGKAITSVIGDITRAFQDLINTGRQVAGSVMGLAYRTGQSPRAGAQAVGIEQSFGLPAGSMGQMFGQWQQRPEFLQARFAAMGIPVGMQRNGDLDYPQTMAGLRGWYQQQSPLMRVPMLQAALGAPPSTEMLRMMNMPQREFAAGLDRARDFEQNAGALRRLYEVLDPVTQRFSVLATAIKLDVLTAFMPIMEAVIKGLEGLWANARPHLQDWLQEKLPHYLSIAGNALIDFAQGVLRALPSVLDFLRELGQGLATAYNGLKAFTDGLRQYFPGIPALPALPGSAGAAGGGSGAVPGGSGAERAGATVGRAGAWAAEHPWLTAAAVLGGPTLVRGATGLAGRGLVAGARGLAGGALLGSEAGMGIAGVVGPALVGTGVGLYAGGLAQRAGGWGGAGISAAGILGGAAAGAGVGAGIGALGAGIGALPGAAIGAVVGAGSALVGEGLGALWGPQRQAARAAADARDQQRRATKAGYVSMETVAREQGWWDEEEGMAGQSSARQRWASQEAYRRTQVSRVPSSQPYQGAINALERLRPTFDEHKMKQAIKEAFAESEIKLDGQLTGSLKVEPAEMSRALEGYIALDQIRRVQLAVS